MPFDWRPKHAMPYQCPTNSEAELINELNTEPVRTPDPKSLVGNSWYISNVIHNVLTKVTRLRDQRYTN